MFTPPGLSTVLPVQGPRHQPGCYTANRGSFSTACRRAPEPCDGGRRLFVMYFATVVWPTSMPSLRSLPWSGERPIADSPRSSHE
jgi:hypothetical protein